MSEKIHFEQGDIFDSGAEALVNPVNCVGVMGAGLALGFKRRWPAYFAHYVAACRSGELRPGRIHEYWTNSEEKPNVIFSLPTKMDWQLPSRLEDVDAGLAALVRRVNIANEMFGISSIAVPALGCGLGGLDWAEVEPLMVRYLGGLDWLGVDVAIYLPQ